MSYSQRSLYNNTPQVTNAQSGIVAQIVRLLYDASAVKTVRNLSLSSSTIDDSVIGSITPSSGRFTSLTAGILNANFPVTLYGPNGSQLSWRDGTLNLVNTSLSCSVLFLKTLSRIQWDDQVYIEHQADKNVVCSDPIFTIGDAWTTPCDMGIIMKNHHYFGLTKASNRVKALTRDTYSFQIMPTTAILPINSNKTISNDPNNVTQTKTALECEWLFAKQQRVSCESILLNDNTTMMSVDTTLHTSKVYGLRTTALTAYNISLPDGDDDGHIKCIQYLPQTGITALQVMTDPTGFASTVPSLLIQGKFCLPPTGIYQSSITLNGFSISVILQFDMVLKAWIMLSNGAM